MMTDNNRKSGDPYLEREKNKYQQPIPSREYIIICLLRKKKSQSFASLCKLLAIDDVNGLEAFERRLQAMVRIGQLVMASKDHYTLPKKSLQLQGKVTAARDGSGVFTSEQQTALISPQQMRSLIPGDVITAFLYPVASYDYRLLVLDVVASSNEQIIGRFRTSKDCSYVVPSNRIVNRDIIIADKDSAGAVDDQVVLVAIDSQAKKLGRLQARVIKKFGDYFDPRMETTMAIYNYKIPNEWDAAVIDEVAAIASTIDVKEAARRIDLRTKDLITIDGDDARDFDDAIYCQPNKDGSWQLYVAIADVSYYVTPDTPLDISAKERGTSVYFPDFVVPMLPEKLSNGLCSLKPDVDRLCMVCELAIAADGEVNNFKFYEGIMRSSARMTYSQVASILDGDIDLQARYASLLPAINNLHALYQILKNNKQARGAIEFEGTQTKILFSKDKKIETIIPAPRNVAHKIVEECMLAANVAAATFIESNNLCAMYRVHLSPPKEKVQAVSEFLKEFGLVLSGGNKPSPRDYALILEQTRARDDAHLIDTVMLRSMSQAYYSHENLGHFGLSFPCYSHFTSPIRRYPDLVLHRAIKQQLNANKPLVIDDLEQLAEHCSSTERRADEATREVISWLKCEYMSHHIGDVFSGIVSGVTHFGLFVELNDIYTEGLLHISELIDDYYLYDEIRHLLIGERAGRTYRLGDSITVKLVRVELDERKIDFALS